MKLRTLALCLSFAWLAAPAQQAAAFSGGISSAVLGGSGCNAAGACHGQVPGTLPVVALSGPTTVTAGDTNEYALTITSPAGQLSGGLNVSSLLGDFLTGGSDSAQTQTVASGAGGNSDITQLGAKVGNGSEVVFSFLWTAPGSAGPATIDAWGNAVNHNFNSQGDGATFTSLAITVEAGPPPSVPATSPWAQAGMMALLLAVGSLFVFRRRASLF